MHLLLGRHLISLPFMEFVHPLGLATRSEAEGLKMLVGRRRAGSPSRRLGGRVPAECSRQMSNIRLLGFRHPSRIDTQHRFHAVTVLPGDPRAFLPSMRLP
jgi:hypothetical protein